MQSAKILLTLYSCCITLTIAAINGQLYSSELLASSSVTDICQDHYGFIWIATDHGLSRFDGYHFTNHHHIHRDTTTLPDNYVGCFLTDRKGNLWVGHGKGLCRYDYASEHFIRQPFPNDIQPRVTTMVQDKAGNIYIGTAGMGMYVMSEGKIIQCGEFSDGTNNHFFAHLHIDKKGNLWSGNHKDMAYLYKMKDGKIQSYKAFHSPKGEPMTFIDIDSQKELLICKQGILLYDYATDKLIDANYDLSAAKGDLTLNHAYLAPSGKLYLGTYGHGLLVIEKGEKTAKQEPLTENHRQQAIPYVSHIMQDKNKNLWLTCYDTGVFLASQQKPAFDNWNLTTQDPQYTGRLTAIAPDANSGAWCAIRQGTLYHLNHQGHIQTRISTPPELRTICHQNKQHYWLGTGNTLYHLDAATGNMQKKQEFKGTGIGQIISDHNRHLYISVYGKGIYQYDTHSGTIQNFNTHTDNTTRHLPNDWVSAMLLDHQGQLWLSTATGVTSMNPQNHSFTPTLLKDQNCGTLCQTKDGNLIISTTHKLYLHHPSTHKTEPLPNTEPLEDISVSSIVEDSQGNLWISTSQGIWQYNRQKKHLINHLNSNRHNTHQYIAGAAITLPDGKIAFGQPNGLTLFHPSNIKQGNHKTGKPHPTHILLDGNPIDFRSDTLIIPHHQNTLTIEFSLLNYENIGNISFQYRLNEGQWVSTTNGSNIITFEKMKPGTYQIDIRAENNGTASSDTLTLTVVVQNPWYLSTWACLLYALIILGLLSIIAVYWRNKVRMRLAHEKLKILLKANHQQHTTPRPHVLMVQDDVETAHHIISELNLKYKFDHAHNGKEALKELLSNTYNLVISDVMMSQMDGITMLKHIKRNPAISKIPVIMLTTKEEEEHKLLGLKAGADAYIAKPVNIDELHLQIDNLIDTVRRLRGKFSGALQQEQRVEHIKVKGNDEALMERIMRSVNAHMSDPEYNVDTLATDIGLSRAQLHRKMKEMTGISSGRFLRNLRMEQAARLLREGKVNISQVADKVGYIDQAHFSTAFKTHFGISPSEYMESKRNT